MARTPDHPRTSAGRHLPAAAVLAVLSAVLILGISRVADEPFGVWSSGYTHDGMNGAMWTASAEAMRSDPIDSRLGARRSVEGLRAVYVNHPPLIVFEAAGAVVLLGEHQWVRRLPAWLGTLAAVTLLGRVMRREGMSATSTAVGLLAGFGTPLVYAYGAMLDTPVTSLPFGLLCVLSLQRERDGEARSWERPASCALAALAGWQALLLAALTIVGRRTWQAAAGVVVGIGLTISWQAWGAGGLGALVDVMLKRSGLSGDSEVALPEALGNQAQWLTELTLVIPLVIAAAGLWLARREAVTRILVASVGVYPLVTADALGIHDYWLYWVTVLIAFGTGAIFERRPRVRLSVVAIGVSVAAVSVLVDTSQVRARDHGIREVKAENASRRGIAERQHLTHLTADDSAPILSDEGLAELRGPGCC